MKTAREWNFRSCMLDCFKSKRSDTGHSSRSVALRSHNSHEPSLNLKQGYDSSATE